MDETEEDVSIFDNGGGRSGKDRRQKARKFQGKEKRSGQDRRHTQDRRSCQNRRQTPERRSTNSDWDASRIERRDAFRKIDDR